MMNVGGKQEVRFWGQPLACRDGFSYVEILVAMVLIAVCLVPALDALQPALFGMREQEVYTIDRLALSSKMEEVLSEPFASLDAAAVSSGSYSVPTGYSQGETTTDGRSITLQVYLAQHDGDGDGTPDPDLLKVKVEIDGTSQRLETLVGE